LLGQIAAEPTSAAGCNDKRVDRIHVQNYSNDQAFATSRRIRSSACITIVYVAPQKETN